MNKLNKLKYLVFTIKMDNTRSFFDIAANLTDNQF